MNKAFIAVLVAVIAAAASPRVQADQPVPPHKPEGKLMTIDLATKDLRGRTVRWTFEDGPMAGTAFEHQFREDGSVVWHALDREMQGVSDHESECATSRVSESVFVISYLGGSGYTLTVVLNTDLGSALGFASNGREWHEMKGTFELVARDPQQRHGADRAPDFQDR